MYNKDLGFIFFVILFGFQDKLVLQKKIIGEKKYSQFGYAVANAGDLNRDGYNGMFLR